MADIANEALLLFVGTGVGVVLNLYIQPGFGDSHTLCTEEIEEMFISLLVSRMASELGRRENGEQPDGRGFQALNRHWAGVTGERRAYEGWRTVFWRTRAIILLIWG